MGGKTYLPVSQDDSLETSSCSANEEPMSLQTTSKPRRFWSRYWCYGALVLSIFFNGILLGLSYPIFEKEGESRRPLEYAVPVDVPPQYKHFWWNTEYSAPNHTTTAALWDKILPSHGIVAVDRRYAAARNWPETMYLPSDHSKGVYLLEAYHQLHCLRILRKTMIEALTDKPFTYAPGEHMEHCFDYLLQTTMCNADSTPLYTFGDGTAGHGQLHMCKDWQSLEDFATRHPACYRDSEKDILLGEHFGYCDDGWDGLLVPTPQEVRSAH